MDNYYNVLNNRKVIDILIGDEHIGDYGEEMIYMPYYRGLDLCELSKQFGLYQEYSWEKGFSNLSRWKYMENLLVHCIKENKVSQLLIYMTNKDKFEKILNGLKSNNIQETYKTIIKIFIEKINSIIYFSDYIFSFISNQYVLKKIGNQIDISAPNIKIIDIEYIRNLSNRALKCIEEDDYDSAITKSRTLLEETFCYVIEQKQEQPSTKGDIGKLYNQVKNLYNMHPNKDMDVRINKLISGLEKIVSSIGEMRNKASDSHGVGSKRVNIDSYHARLCVNSASVIAEFIISICNQYLKNIY